MQAVSATAKTSSSRGLQSVRNKKQILVFGGSFNPVHRGHEKIMDFAMKQVNPDLGLVSSAYVSPFKGSSSPASPLHRLRMLELVFARKNRVVITDHELQRAKPSYTADFIREIDRINGSAAIFLLVGSDVLAGLHKWKDFTYLNSRVTWVIARRHGYDKVPDFLERTIALKNIPNGIASQDVREGAVKDQLPLRVSRYINNNLLYTEERIATRIEPARWVHSKAVAKLASDLALKHAPRLVERATYAGLYHDIAKDLDFKHASPWLKGVSEANFNIDLQHAAVGARMVKTLFMQSEQGIINAIARHTEGSLHMSKLDMILYLADKLEVNRKHPRKKYLVDLAFKNLKLAYKQTYLEMIELYKARGIPLSKKSLAIKKRLEANR